MEEDHLHNEDENIQENSKNETITRVSGMFKDWFLDYASYVILERAVPAIEDGFKPVQRRIMQSMKDLDDGRYNKVANIVGHTMQYHPHGDASIADAMVQIGQKDLLIDTQGNWGNILTGDSAAASRYIEARLSKFAIDVVFNPKITEWQSSYDGRRKEPVNLPVMFPLLLAQGGEGIAVGLSTKILPHNFIELIDASIKHLKGSKFTIYPDFPTAGKANEKGKIKVRKIDDNTAARVEILVHLPAGISPDKTIDALYAFTNCEVSISPLGCVIEDNRPLFVGVTEMLRHSTDNTVQLLKQNLELKLDEFEEQWHFASLERIFIENRIYRDIEEEETWDGVVSAIDAGLQPHIKHLKRAITTEDIERLTEIRIKRISKFDIDKAQQKIDTLEEQIAQVKHDLAHLIDFAIAYFTRLKNEYGKGRERLSEIRLFDDVDASKVVIRNTKLYVNKEEGFVGTSLKRDEYVCDCSDIDEIIVFTRDGKMMVTKVDAKTFVGKDIINVEVFNRKDKRTIYNMVYRDGAKGPSYVKRFSVIGVTRDREYDLTNGNKGSTALYFSSNPNGEAEVITIFLRQVASVKKLKWDLDFADILIKGRNSKGNVVTKHAIRKIELKERGISTLKPRKIWFDDTVQRLNADGRGELIGEFRGEDRLLIINQSGTLKTILPELTSRFDDDMIVLEKWIPKKPISAIYFDGEKERYYVKRFVIEVENREEVFISEHAGSNLEIVSTDYRPVAEVEYTKERGKDRKDNWEVNLEEFITIKGINALGNQLTKEKVNQISLMEPLPYEVPEELPAEEIEVVDEDNISEVTAPQAPDSDSEDDSKDDSDDDEQLEENGQGRLF